MTEHSFVVPAYGRSPFLEPCLLSLAQQEKASQIIISTSTPFPGLEALASRYGAKLHVHGPNGGIGHDWNEALRIAPGTWITLAHQDDLYHRTYTREMLAAVAGIHDASMALSYGLERKTDSNRALTPLIVVKRALTELAFLKRHSIRGASAKRRLLMFGNPVMCPSVMLNSRLLNRFGFREDLSSNLDWAAWLELAAHPGSFVLCRKPLVIQRTHAGGATTSLIRQGRRYQEDTAIFQSLWPRPIAQFILLFYRLIYINRRRML